MTLRTKASLKSFYETGDKPTQSNFEDLIDTMVAVPTAATFPSIIEVESTVSSTSRPIGAVGRRLVEASATSQVTDLLAIPASIAHSTFGVALVSAANTAAARDLLAITAGASAGAAGQAVVEAGTTVAAQQALDLDRDSIGGFILTPVARLYAIDQRARVPYTVDWIAAQVSAGHCAVTLLTDTSIITGLSSAAVDTTEVAVSASAGSGNLIGVGETLNLRISDVSSNDALSFTIGITRT